MNRKIHRLGVLALMALLPLFQACSTQPAQLNTQPVTVEQSTPLMEAARQGDLERVEELVEAGAPINARGPEGTALMAAVRAGHAEVVVKLLRLGADPAQADAEGVTPLMIAARDGRSRLVRYLLGTGARINHASADGRTAVSMAALAGNLALVKQLLAAGGNVNIQLGNESLLMKVVRANDLLMTQVLIDAGADVHFQNPQGLSALDVAREQGNRDLQMLLIQSGAQG